MSTTGISQPALDVLEGSQLELHCETTILKTFQKHLKSDDFYVASLRRLKHISKNRSLMSYL